MIRTFAYRRAGAALLSASVLALPAQAQDESWRTLPLAPAGAAFSYGDGGDSVKTEILRAPAVPLGYEPRPPAPAPEAVQAAAEPVDPQVPAKVQAQVPAPAPPEPFRTADVTTATFASLRTAALDAASVPGAGPQARLDLVRVLLGGMFVPEALGEIARLQEAGPLPAPYDQVLAEMTRAAAALGNRDPRAAGVPGTDLWGTLGALRRAETVTAPEVRGAAVDLAGHSRWVAGEALPHLFAGALALGDTALASDLLGAAEAGTDLAGTPRHLLMQGRLAQATGAEEEAFDFYAAALAGEGTAAIEARIALADLILARGDPSALPGLKRLLREGVASWRGDDHARRMMARLAAVTEETGDIEGALKVMATILAGHGDSPEARLARTRIPVLLGALEKDVKAGEMPIGHHLALVRDLARTMPETTEWVGARVALAESLERHGLLRAAAAEYREIRTVYPLIFERAAGLRARIVLGEGAARIASGDHAGALAALSVPIGEGAARDRRRQEALRAQAEFLLAAGRPGESPLDENDALLVRARRAADSDDRIVAADLYKQYLAAEKTLPREDVSLYMLARSGTAASARVPADNLMGQGEDVQRILDAGRTTAPGPTGNGPLSTETAAAVLARADDAIGMFGPLLGEEDAAGGPVPTPTPEPQAAQPPQDR